MTGTARTAVSVRQRGSGQVSRIRSERRWATLFASPYLIHLVLLMAWPLIALAYLSFTQYDTLSAPRWVGLDNYSRLFGDGAFWRSLGNTGVFAIIFVPLQTALALLLAVALNQRLRFIPLLRGAYFVPVVSSWVVIAYVADSVFNPRTGLANTALAWVGIDPQTWLNDPALVIPTLAVVAVWKGVGYMMVLFLAALQAIPKDLYDAAEVDGAGAWHRFRNITMPGVSGTTFLVLVMSTISTLQAFDQVFVMTDGGPNGASEVTVLYMFRQGFQFFQMGYAAAIAWVLFAIILVLTLFQMWLQKKWVHYA
jgi:multiple sugar transport system permease protein